MAFLSSLKARLIDGVAAFLRHVAGHFQRKTERPLEEERGFSGKLSAFRQFVEHFLKLLKPALQPAPEADFFLSNRFPDPITPFREFLVIAAHVVDDGI